MIDAKRLEDGWHTVMDGVFGAKISHSKEEALVHGDRVARGLARWQPLSEAKMHDVDTFINRRHYPGPQQR